VTMTPGRRLTRSGSCHLAQKSTSAASLIARIQSAMMPRRSSTGGAMDRCLNQLARQLRRYRVEEKLSQEEAALQIGCSLPTYRSLEHWDLGREQTDPRLSTVVRVATAIGLTISISASAAQ